jgi:hypothetical protein
MKRILHLAAVAVLALTGRAHAVGDLAQVSIVDRDSGAVLEAHYHRGEYWVAGKPGGRYAIEIRNIHGERVMAVTSVDGVNVLSGATAGWDQDGYVFDSGQEYQITGWRKNDSEVAAFTFTDSHNSYAERTGRPANVGVIGVAVFRERIPPPVYASPPRMAAVSPPAADTNSAAARSRIESQAMLGAAPLAKLGTGHGEREYSPVIQTHFVRLETQPNEVIRIHYDSLDNLFAGLRVDRVGGHGGHRLF